MPKKNESDPDKLITVPTFTVVFEKERALVALQ